MGIDTRLATEGPGGVLEQYCRGLKLRFRFEPEGEKRSRYAHI